MPSYGLWLTRRHLTPETWPDKDGHVFRSIRFRRRSTLFGNSVSVGTASVGTPPFLGLSELDLLDKGNQ